MTTWLRWQATCLADDIRRLRHGLGVLWRSGGPGRHALAWGETAWTGTVDIMPEITGRVIPRKPVTGRPPWETAPMPAVCLIPVPAPKLHPVVQAVIEEQLGVASVNEFVISLFRPVWAAI